jgi:hypothetical protein
MGVWVHQQQWLHENKNGISNANNWISEIVQKQIETVKPDILYLTDPVSLDSQFLRKLSWRPRLIFAGVLQAYPTQQIGLILI